jgi:hypothetical protein
LDIEMKRFIFRIGCEGSHLYGAPSQFRLEYTQAMNCPFLGKINNPCLLALSLGQ